MCNKENLSHVVQSHFESGLHFPFPSSDYWEWLGYSRHASFKRCLEADEFRSKVVWDDCNPQTIGERKRETVWISRTLFYELVEKKRPEYLPKIDEVFRDGYRKLFLEKNLHFYFTKAKEYRTTVSAGAVAGHFYTYGLNTKNLAQDLDICPFEVYKFCATRFCSKYDYGGVRIDGLIPFVHFDSQQHSRRYLFLEFLYLFRKEGKLDRLRSIVLDTYIEFVKTLLDKQVDFDIKAGKMGRKSTPVSKEKIDEELKKLYRKAVLLSHPDKWPARSHVFLKLQAAWEDQRFNEVRSIYNHLVESK